MNRFLVPVRREDSARDLPNQNSLSRRKVKGLITPLLCVECLRFICRLRLFDGWVFGRSQRYPAVFIGPEIRSRGDAMHKNQTRRGFTQKDVVVKNKVILNRGLYRLAAPRKVVIRGLIKRCQDLIRLVVSLAPAYRHCGAGPCGRWACIRTRTGLLLSFNCI